MKIRNLLEYSLIYFVSLFILAVFALFFHNAFDLSLGANGAVTSGLGVVTLLLTVTYWLIQRKYSSLTKISTPWLVVLLTISLLSIIGSIMSNINTFSVYIPTLTKEADPLTYLLFALGYALFTQVIILLFIVTLIPPFIAFQTAKVLHARFSSNTFSK